MIDAQVLAQTRGELVALVVWEHILPSDVQAEAEGAARGIVDRRIRQFWDPAGRSGQVFQQVLHTETPSWDVYLGYPPGVRWEAGAPPPRPTLFRRCPTCGAYALRGAEFRQNLGRMLRGEAPLPPLSAHSGSQSH